MKNTGDHLWQRWTICGSNNWSRGPSAAAKIAIDGPGDHLQWGINCSVTGPTFWIWLFKLTNGPLLLSHIDVNNNLLLSDYDSLLFTWSVLLPKKVDVCWSLYNSKNADFGVVQETVAAVSWHLAESGDIDTYVVLSVERLVFKYYRWCRPSSKV